MQSAERLQTNGDSTVLLLQKLSGDESNLLEIEHIVGGQAILLGEILIKHVSTIT